MYLHIDTAEKPPHESVETFFCDIFKGFSKICAFPVLCRDNKTQLQFPFVVKTCRLVASRRGQMGREPRCRPHPRRHAPLARGRIVSTRSISARVWGEVVAAVHLSGSLEHLRSSPTLAGIAR